MESAPNTNQNHLGRILLWIGAIVLIAVLAYFGTRNTALFRAELLSAPGDPTNKEALYIPNNYIANSPDTEVTIQVIANEDLNSVKGFTVGVRFPDMVNGVAPPISYNVETLLGLGQNTVFSQSSGSKFVDPQDGEDGEANDPNFIYVGFTANSPVDVELDSILFELNFNINDGLEPGDELPIIIESTIIKDEENVPIEGLSIADGLITISCNDTFCGENGTCSSTSGQCVCDQGYDGAQCGACAAGFLGFPNCAINTFQDLEALVLTLGPGAISQLSEEEREQAFNSAYLLVNSTDVMGAAISVEGNEVEIEDYSQSTDECGASGTDKECIDLITASLKSDLEALNTGAVGQPLLAVSTVKGVSEVPVPGLLKLTATDFNENQSVDITSALGGLRVVPGLELGVNLGATDSLPVELIGKNNDGSPQTLTFLDVIWLPQPLNRLNNEALNGGLFEPGDVAGSGPVFARLQKADGSAVNSNTVIVNTARGPVIEDLQRVGVGPITQGTVVDLRVRVSDVNTIADIQDITVFLQSADGTQTFSAKTFEVPVEQIEETDSGAEQTADGSQFYKIYEFPFQILGDASQFDGAYQLMVEILDKEGNLATGTLSITIGAPQKGDVNLDGQLNNLDVALLYRIVDKSYVPNAAQLLAADVNTDGQINEDDTEELFRQLADQ